MKKVINGKSYNCETAKEIAYARSDCGKSDFSWWEETLYKKSTGEYFLAGEGGPMSRYSQASGSNSTIAGSAIVPLTLGEMQLWLEEKSDHDTWVAILGEPPE